jgi:hypothetical protein
MNVGELKRLLNYHPDSLEICVDKWSDFTKVTEVRRIEGVPNVGDWIMRAHETMSEINKANVKQFLYIG